MNDDLKEETPQFPAKPPAPSPERSIGPEGEVRGGPEAPEETLEERPAET